MTSPAIVAPTAWTVQTRLTNASVAPGETLAGITSIEVRDGIAPIVPSVRVEILKGIRLTAPTPDNNPQFAFPADKDGGGLSIDNFLRVTSAVMGRDYYIMRTQAEANGPYISLVMEGVDPRSARLARAVLAPAVTGSIYYPFTFNPNGVPNSSASYPYIFDWSAGNLWTRGHAFQPIFDAVNVGVTGADPMYFNGSDYMALQVASGSYDPTITGSWDVDGYTAMEGVLTVLGTRGRWSFYVPASGPIQLVDLAPTSGAALDLTSFPDLITWSYERDQSNTVKSVRVFAPGEVTVTTVSLLGGGIAADWVAGDITALNAGDTTSPAYQRFTVSDALFPTLALLNSLPMTAVALPDLSQARPFLIFLKTGGLWVPWNGKASIAVEATTLVVNGGTAWTAAYLAATDMAITLSYMSLAMRSNVFAGTDSSGLAGITLRRDVAAFKTTVRANTAYAVSGGAFTTSGGTDISAYVGSSDVGGLAIPKETAELGALAARYRPRLRWSRKGIIAAMPPNTAIGVANLPGLGNFTVNGCIIEKIYRVQGADQVTEWIVDFPPITQVGQL